MEKLSRFKYPESKAERHKVIEKTMPFHEMIVYNKK